MSENKPLTKNSTSDETGEAASEDARQASIKPGEPLSAEPRISWDVGTAYDLFFSLYVLHLPEKFGLRASWAAGVRSRLNAEDRKVLATAQKLFYVPLCWIYSLPEPKDAETALWALRQIPAGERLQELSFCDLAPEKIQSFLNNIAERGVWEDQDLESLRKIYREKGKEKLRPKELADTLDAWANAAEFGEHYLSALQAYYNAFYAEEQCRIGPAIQKGLQSAKDLAERLPLIELIEELSHGIRFEEPLDKPEIIFVPSFWIQPLIYFSLVSQHAMLIVFGFRPEDISVVPGEQVPDSILLGLKALSDPTRLRILRYLNRENLSPADLARRLRLRAPTVTYHLRSLRLAGLVHMTVGKEHESRYTARLETIEELCTRINGFLASVDEE